MVRREGSRFGVSTSHNVRRLPVPYSRVHAQQSILIDTKLNAGPGSRHLNNEAKSALRKQLQRGSFDVQGLYKLQQISGAELHVGLLLWSNYIYNNSVVKILVSNVYLKFWAVLKYSHYIYSLIFFFFT